ITTSAASPDVSSDFKVDPCYVIHYSSVHTVLYNFQRHQFELDMHASVFLVLFSIFPALSQASTSVATPSSITPPPTSATSGPSTAFIGYSYVTQLGGCWSPLKWLLVTMTYTEMKL